ncbi:hypothetical protein UFOVP941_46 [uncultured Caudovirales phage]|uniref:Uncharacterized protein n=1 Tax=uncultured Caudovirales phage TaxID=2100421 RepID=A0A6J5PV47_9CAUD|nr:hypothetical protein UFOVP941_46 [uncultured Caudovirales phage]CAB4202796.1 hypothetical protein UFOVP1373_41 [uncultured Caudovirales phage]
MTNKEYTEKYDEIINRNAIKLVNDLKPFEQGETLHILMIKLALATTSRELRQLNIDDINSLNKK